MRVLLIGVVTGAETRLEARLGVMATSGCFNTGAGACRLSPPLDLHTRRHVACAPCGGSSARCQQSGSPAARQPGSPAARLPVFPSNRTWPLRSFINHFRNAECPTKNTMRAVGTTMPGGWTGGVAEGSWSQTSTGGFAQCCSSCTAAKGCAGWTYHKNNCTLMSSITGWYS